MTEAEPRDPNIRQQQPNLELRHVRAALKPLLDKLDALEAQYGASYLASGCIVLTNVEVLREIRTAVERADG
jgi:hypothetical protein